MAQGVHAVFAGGGAVLAVLLLLDEAGRARAGFHMQSSKYLARAVSLVLPVKYGSLGLGGLAVRRHALGRPWAVR